MRLLKKISIALLVLAIFYFAGPKPATPVFDNKLPNLPPVGQLEQYIAAKEATHALRPGNQAEIIWNDDSAKSVTDYALVYLHGFSASQKEGNPVHKNIARKFGCNLYLARLAEHGLDTSEKLLRLSPENLWESAKEALAVGRKIGKKVLLMSTSTGGTLSLQLAAAFPNEIAGLILYSPNIAINDPNAFLLNDPWGLQIARLVIGNNSITPPDTSTYYKTYWDSPYRLEAAVSLESLLESTMNKQTFEGISQPLLMLYYFKDEKNQDPVVKVSAMKKMFEQIHTPDSLKKAVAISDAGGHVIANKIKSKNVAQVEKETADFLEQVLHLNKQPSASF